MTTRPWLWRALLLPAALSALTLRSLFHGGYLLQVDSVFGPRFGVDVGGLGAPVSLLEQLGTRVVGGEVTGALYVGGALFAVGAAAMLVTRRLPWYAQCLAGLIAVFNPWVYDRTIEGQWGLVVAAAGLFLWLGAWEALRSQPSLRRALALGIVAAITVVFSPHAVAMVALLTIGAAIASRSWRDRELLRWAAASIGVTVVLLLYGVVDFLSNHSPQGYNTVTAVGRPDFVFFRTTRAAGHGLVLDLLGLYGYWGEGLGRFPLATNGWSWWPLIALALALAAVAGAFACRRRAWLLPVGLLGLVLAGSTATGPGLSAVTHVASALRIVGAYREPQKLSVLWLLALGTLVPAAVARLAASTRAVLAPALAYVLALAVVLPAGIASVRNLANVVDPVAYPASWYATERLMERTVPRHARVVVLPWHLYEVLPFTSRLALDPAPYFFPGQLIMSGAFNPPRFGEPTPGQARIGEAASLTSPASCSLAAAIRAMSASWVLALDLLDYRTGVDSLVRCGFRIVNRGPAGPLLLVDTG